jgi:hypothetical protein
MSCNCNDKNNNNKNIYTLGSISCISQGNLVDTTVYNDCDDEELVILKGACSPAKLRGMLTTDEEITWTQIFIPEVLCIPEQKPDVEQLVSVTSVPEIFSQRVVKTPISGTVSDEGAFTPIENQEGTIITGRKLVIEGILKQKVVYTAALEQQPLHSAHFDVPFSAFIILPYGTPLTRKYKIETCIEDIFVCRTTPRQVFKNITLFIKATPLVCV